MATSKNTTDTTKKTTKTTVKAPSAEGKKVNAEIEELKQSLEALKAQNELLRAMFMEIQKNSTNTAAPTLPTSSLNDEVTLVHLIENAPGLTTHIVLSNLTMDLSAFGEERTLDRRQAEEIAGKYRKWFEKGIIAFGKDGDEYASRFGLKSINDYTYIDKNFVKRLAGLSLFELENLYNKLGEGHKQFIISYFKRKIVEGDPEFKNIHKVEMLNRVSGGAMSGTILDFQREAETAEKDK